MMVKICGITHRDDALAAVDAGAAALGFNFYPQSPRYVPPAKAAELGRGIDVLRVGIFVNEQPAQPLSTSRRFMATRRIPVCEPGAPAA
jgi:phosphoribosylanthranilate isomerase